MTRNHHTYTDQHFLSSTDTANKIVSAAKIKSTDTVFEAGTGTGALVRQICERAAHVISVELDTNLHDDARTHFGNISNLELIQGDAFLMTPKCDVFISSLPYSQSRRAFEWMAQQTFDRSALIVQKEFAAKLSPLRLEERRAISVMAHAAFEIKHVSNVNRQSFSPPPHVDSVILALHRRQTLDASTIRAINSLFSYRRKTLQSALRSLGAKTVLHDTVRLEELKGDEIVRIAQTIES